MSGCGIRKARPDSDYDKSALRIGTKIEMEHTTNRALAKNIAKNHLDEFPDYYDELPKMEARMKKRTNSKKRRH